MNICCNYEAVADAITPNSQVRFPRKIWRKLVKKLRRKKKRKLSARQRYEKQQIEESIKLKDPTYRNWFKEQSTLEICREETMEHLRMEEEEKWMRRELLAQMKFKRDEKLRLETESAKEAERLKIQKEFEILQNRAQQKRDIRQQELEENAKNHRNMLLKIDEYVNGNGDPPSELRETANSNPGKENCPFFVKTAACRFGDKCSRNHSRPGLSRIILVRNFFGHIRLEQSRNTEYGSDIGLEYTDSEVYRDFQNFYTDVVPEFESFGKILNFKVCSNCQQHLRGNVYTEFESNREALNAYMKLQGRYYAGKRINVEFCSLISWKTAVCGENYTKKCPKGKNCNYLHVFKNPSNKYTNFHMHNLLLNMNGNQRQNEVTQHKSSWDIIEGDSSKDDRNWRWSESPDKSPVKTSTNKANLSPKSQHSKHREDENRQSTRTRNTRAEKSTRHKRSRHSRSKTDNKEHHKTDKCKTKELKKDSTKRISKKVINLVH